MAENNKVTEAVTFQSVFLIEDTGDDTDVIVAQFVELEVDSNDDGPSSTGCTTITLGNAVDTVGDEMEIICDGTNFFVKGRTNLDGGVVLA